MRLDTEKLKLALEENCMSQSDLARAIGCRPPSVCRYLYGKQQPKLKTLGRIAESLNVSVIDLIDDTD